MDINLRNQFDVHQEHLLSHHVLLKYDVLKQVTTTVTTNRLCSLTDTLKVQPTNFHILKDILYPVFWKSGLNDVR